MTDPDLDTEASATPEAPSAAGAEPTGVSAADEAAEQLRALDDAPLGDHVGIYEDVHLRLQDALADLDDRAP